MRTSKIKTFNPSEYWINDLNANWLYTYLIGGGLRTLCMSCCWTVIPWPWGGPMTPCGDTTGGGVGFKVCIVAYCWSPNGALLYPPIWGCRIPGNLCCCVCCWYVGHAPGCWKLCCCCACCYQRNTTNIKRSWFNWWFINFVTEVQIINKQYFVKHKRS